MVTLQDALNRARASLAPVGANNLGLTVDRIAVEVATIASHRPDLLDWLVTVRDRTALTK